MLYKYYFGPTTPVERETGLLGSCRTKSNRFSCPFSATGYAASSLSVSRSRSSSCAIPFQESCFLPLTQGKSHSFSQIFFSLCSRTGCGPPARRDPLPLLLREFFFPRKLVKLSLSRANPLLYENLRLPLSLFLSRFTLTPSSNERRIAEGCRVGKKERETESQRGELVPVNWL